jgi:hypothetical protein
LHSWPWRCTRRPATPRTRSSSSTTASRRGSTSDRHARRPAAAALPQQRAGALDTLWFHLHLNAFRPNSAWARRELEFGERRFQDLGPEEHAFERVTRVVVDGAPVRPVYPGAPDSTVMAVPLPRAAGAQGAAVVVEMDWDARLSTLPRRQGRAAATYDFAQWYPRIAVHDRGGWQVQPLLPQGEFFGEFGSYDVTLEVAADQVIGATGVPVEGDPGWERAAARPGTRAALPPRRLRAASAEPLGLLAGDTGAGPQARALARRGRAPLRWSTSPTTSTRAARYGDVAVHVLYQPATGLGRTARRERTVSRSPSSTPIFGPYPWPQITNVHRIEGGGTEFPMLIMNGSRPSG